MQTTRHTHTIPLPDGEPFDPQRVMRSIRTTSFGVPYLTIGPDAFFRTLRVENEWVLVRVDLGRATRQRHIQISLQGGDALGETPHLQQEALALVIRMLSLEDRLTDCYSTLCRDPLLAPLVSANFGLRMLRAPSVFETVFTVILGQQISVTAANAQRRRLLEYFASPVQGEGSALRSVPAPETLAQTPMERLSALGVSRQKAHYLKAAATWAAEGRLERARLLPMPDPAIVDYLAQLPGIGPWSAQMVLMRALPKNDIFPSSDLGLQNAVRKIYGLNERPSVAALDAIAERWRGWRSYAALYLWSLGAA